MPQLWRSLLSTFLVHALTDVAIDCRSCGPKAARSANVANSNRRLCCPDFRVSTLVIAIAALFFVIGYSTASAVSNESEVRATVDKIFQNLKDKNYEALYDTLPANTRSRITRERFASSLRHTQDNYALDRMDVGKIRVSGNIAVVDTDLYGRLLKPFDMEGKIVVQQYLVREDGKWKVATGDNATMQRFLKSNPAFARQFKIRPPRVFVKKDGSWVEFTPPKR